MMSSNSEQPVTSSALNRQIQVLLTLHDDERSFGMSLAQKVPAVGAKYTVVSSVFAKSPADRAGVRKGYVVRRINDKPMGGLTVAQVANHFRNVAQARITLEVVENAMPTKISATTLEGVAVSDGQGLQALVTKFSASSGRAIAAPGSALVGPKVPAPKQSILRLGVKSAAKSLGLQSQAEVTPSAFANMSSTAVKCGNAGAVIPSADAKIASGVSHSGLKNKSVVPVPRLGPKQSVQSELKAQKVAVFTTTIDSEAKSVLGIVSNTSTAETCFTSSRIPPSPIKVIEAPSIAASVQVGKEHKITVAAAQSNGLPATSPRVPEAAAKATAPVSAVSLSVTAKKSVSASSSLSIGATRAAVKTPTGNVVLQPMSSSATESSSTVLHSSSASCVETTGVKSQASSAPVVSTANSTKRSVKNVSPAPAAIALVLGATPPERAKQIPAVYPPKPAVVTAMPPIEVAPRSKPGLARSTMSTPVQSMTRKITVASPSVPLSPVTIPAPPPTTKTSKKRGRQRTTKATNGTNGTSNKGKGKAKKAAKQQQERDRVDSILGDDDVFDCYAFTSDSDLEESPSKKAIRRTAKGRRRGVTDRTRHSLTIVRLVDMGFRKEDAEASVKEIGDDLDACMVWIISKIEERQFNEDLNRASIQSERSKQDEEKRVKKLEKEKLANAEKFMVVFPTSYMVCTESTASHLKNFLQSTVDKVYGGSYLREVLSELMKLESKSIRWYKEASRSYMLELAERLNTVLKTHDVMTCCARALASDTSSPNGCKFVQQIVEEVKALTTALFEMPTNQGGVPQVFLECDETTKFDLEDDGFEVVELND